MDWSRECRSAASKKFNVEATAHRDTTKGWWYSTVARSKWNGRRRTTKKVHDGLEK
jgi:hypothetical protein